MVVRRDRGAEVANAGRGDRVAIPLPGKRSDEVALESQVLPAANAWKSSSSIDVVKSRWVHFYITYTSNGAGGEWGLLPEVHAGYRGDSGELTEKWVPLASLPSNAAANEFTLVATPAGGDSTGDKFDKVVVRPVVYGGAPTTGSDTVTTVISVNVEGAQLLRVSMAEFTPGAGGAGTMEVRYTKST